MIIIRLSRYVQWCSHPDNLMQSCMHPVTDKLDFSDATAALTHSTKGNNNLYRSLQALDTNNLYQEVYSCKSAVSV